MRIPFVLAANLYVPMVNIIAINTNIQIINPANAFSNVVIVVSPVVVEAVALPAI
jgi:hypothetical protein